MLREKLCCGLGDHDVDATADSVESDGVVCWVRCEDCDGVAGREGVDGCFVSIWVPFLAGWVGCKACVEVVVDAGDVFVEVFSYIRSINQITDRT